MEQLKNPTKKDLGGIDIKEALIHMLAGASARMTAAVLLCPLDTIKTRLQFQGKFNVKHYNGPLDALVTISREEGISGFTRGLPARVIYQMPAAAVSFFFYEKIVKGIRMPNSVENHLLHTWLPLAGITVARVLGSVLRTPFDIVKQRMQVDGTLKALKYKNSFQAAWQIGRDEGFKSMFSNAHVALMRDAPFALLYFSGYEVMKDIQRKITGQSSNEKLSTVNHLIGGAVAGSIATALTIPFDVLKTRLQTQRTLPREEWRYFGVIDAAKKIIAEEGFRGLLQGLGPRVMYIAPSSALVWASYESYKKVFSSLL